MAFFEGARSFLRGRINKLLERVLGMRLYSIRTHGREDWFDIKSSGYPIKTIFDVGANVGQSARKFRSAFPDAKIYSFEPVKTLFDELANSFDGDAQVFCFQLALGSARGMGKIYYTDHRTTSSLIAPDSSRGFEEVQIETIDDFADRQRISRIDLLKVDAEGYDMEVLKGAEGLLSSNCVRFVLVEVGFHPGDDRHVLFDDARAFLIARGFRVFGIYDQNLEWSGESRLRFANVCFANTVALKELT